MPSTKVDRITEREREIRAIIYAGIERNGIDKKTLAERISTDIRTLYRRFKEPYTFTIGELLSISNVLNLSNEDRLQIIKSYGR